jgi:rhamnulokinase
VEAAALGNVLVQMHAFGDVGPLTEMRDLVRRSSELRSFEPDRAADTWDELYGRFRSIVTPEAVAR